MITVQKPFVYPEVKGIEKLLELVELTFRFNRDLGFYCRQMNLSMYHLNELTRYYMNKTVYEVLQDRIHQEAELLLLTTRRSVKEITYMIGCSDMSYFCRCFKQRTGMTPSDFRDKKLPCASHGDS